MSTIRIRRATIAFLPNALVVFGCGSVFISLFTLVPIESNIPRILVLFVFPEQILVQIRVRAGQSIPAAADLAILSVMLLGAEQAGIRLPDALMVYTITGNPYRSAAYMVMADDEEREYGDAAGAEAKKTEYEALGLEIISMRDDFGTIYGEKVEKAVPAA